MKVIFIDRDGVINRDPAGWTEHSYVTRWEEFQFLPGAKEALFKLTRAGYEIIVISNQGGVNRGLFTMENLREINDNMLKELSRYGVTIRSVHYCPHTEDDDCNCRKPKTGLFEEATKDLDIDFKDTFFIGDGSMDIEAGKRLGCKTIFLLCGKSKLEDVDKWDYKPDFIMKDLSQAVDWILNND